MAIQRFTDDEYMLHSRLAVDEEDDCFWKMGQHMQLTDMGQLEESEEPSSKLCVIHSRYASRRGTIRDDQAHPVFDSKKRVAVFHNGFITNFKELLRELYPYKDPSKSNMSDSELIAQMLGNELDNSTDLKTAITNLLETKLFGTWRMAIIPVDSPNKIFFTKNAGEFYLGRTKNKMNIVVCSDDEIQEHKNFRFEKMHNNTLYEIQKDCKVSQTPIQKRVKVDRKPHAPYAHIFEEEILTSIEAIDAVTDNGSKFISNHQVVLGGFEKAKEELQLIQNIIIAANGPSNIAA